jgi:hypothetical protein
MNNDRVFQFGELKNGDCQKTGKASDFGGKESVKGNRQGSLSRSIKPFFKLFQSLKNASVSKNLY